MDKDAFRNAVSGITWSEAQRQAIIARLQAPRKAADVIDDGTEEFIETDLLSMDDVTYEGDANMEHRKIRKYVWAAAAAAAVLTVGGTAATVAMRGSGQMDSTDMSDRVEVYTPLHLTDDEYKPETVFRWNDWLAMSENGWYYYRSHDVQRPDYLPPNDPNYLSPDDPDYDTLFDENEFLVYEASHKINALYYTDAETGEAVPFCARANCLHDGNDFCPASTTLYATTALQYYDGKLYAFAAKRTEQKDGYDSYDGCYLLCYEPDGTGITELTRFNVGGSGEALAPVIHRGYIFCCVRNVSDEGIPVESPITGETYKSSTSGYVILGYELSTGKTVTVYSSMPAQGSGYQYDCPEYLTATGDYLYYEIRSGATWPSENTGGVYCIDLRTGEHKKLELPEYNSEICPAGNGVLYHRTGEKNEWYWYDQETGESTMLSDDSDINYAVTDGEYIYRLRNEWDNDLTNNVEICDMNMKPIASAEYGKGKNLNGIAVKDGYIYVALVGAISRGKNGEGYYYGYDGSEYIYRCRTEELLSGQAQWDYVLTTRDREVYGVDQ